MSRSSMGQAYELTGKLRDISDNKVQRLFDNWDLVTMLMEHDPRAVDRWAFVQLLEGKLELTDPPARFSGMLVSVFDWLPMLRRYNEKYWGNRFTDEDFAKAKAQLASVPEDHIQSVTNCYGFHVQFGSLEETFEMWYKVYQGELPGAWRWPELKVDAEHLGLHKLARSYEPGIHLVNIDLVAHWEPKDGRTLIEVREQAKSSGEILAQLEVISIYGVLTELFMQQGGQNFPWSDMPGTVLSVPGGSRPCALCVDWSRGGRRAEFRASWVDDRGQSWAAPVLRELQN